MDIHKLLERQLEKLNIKSDKKPESDELWLRFITRVNQTYLDADQERYLHDRAINISSQEMMDLNIKLENAQHIARLGYWTYDGNNDSAIWSKELFTLFNLNPAEKPPGFRAFLELVYEQDRYELEQNVEKALNNKIDYECEIRVRDPDETYHWYRIIAQCQKGEKQLTGVVIDIHKNKMAEEKIKDLNQQIVITARRAGMAEVAATILHNIGNILNSSNISINLLKSSLDQNFLNKLFKLLEVLALHEEDLPDFLINDPKGQVICKYLSALSKILLEEQQKNINEINNLINDLSHIGEIVSMQKAISGTSNMNEKIYLPEIIEIALNMSLIAPYNESIQVVKDYESCALINLDKSKLLQILVNVIQNARDSVLLNTENPIKEIKLLIKKNTLNSIQIIIIDNGVGINPDNLNRIFSFGFTTKKNGHGFGLHSSALYAEGMGGSLFANSLGEGSGSEFILTLPL